jgi:hypothetical protein
LEDLHSRLTANASCLVRPREGNVAAGGAPR